MRRLSQGELTERSGVPAMMISHFETGVRKSASADNLVKLSDALEVSVDYLLGRSDDPMPSSGPVEAALLRTIGEAPSDVIDSVVRIAQTLVDQDREKGRDG
jgi:transcriptional regulator with XRE-family HTH domain